MEANKQPSARAIALKMAYRFVKQGLKLQDVQIIAQARAIGKVNQNTFTRIEAMEEGRPTVDALYLRVFVTIIERELLRRVSACEETCRILECYRVERQILCAQLGITPNLLDPDLAD